MRNPFDKRSRKRGQQPKDQEYWLSYSDLMAGLLMVFVLMLLVAAGRYEEERDQIESLREQVIGVVETMAVRDSIIQDLQQIGNNQLITIDTITGAIRLSDANAVLFDQNESYLKPQGRVVLTRLARDYLPAVLGNERYLQHLREIVIEGHTNDDGTFLHNVELSQERAYAVLNHFLAQTSGTERSLLERYLTARGRSYSEVVCWNGARGFPEDCGPSGVDKAASRRIEILFRLDDEEVVREIRNLLDQAGR